uniref:Retrovirus-related Pol polyprotein from transposon opus n=1 Tax=Tanacetum cinerariifolium TaxID=118510 RepID=A0A6L2MIB7_TANCI|nr:retrovirus-related Pol polyprotein from transposon opus [Tanacetum cinerariifolium]
MIVIKSMIELESLFGHLFDEYFNGDNQVVSKSFVVAIVGASNKHQQQPDSTSSTSNLATTVIADGNFNIIGIIDEILEEDFDALLDEGSESLHSIEGTIFKEKLFAAFDEFKAMTADENSESKSDTKKPPFKKITINTDYKIKTSLKEHPTDLKLKPLPDKLEYVFLEKCHCMVKEGIMLGHKVSEAGLEGDKEKIDVISKLPPPTNIKADHVSRTKNKETSYDSEVDDNFLGETLMEINTEDEPWPVSPEPASGSLLAKRMLVSLSHDQTNGVKDQKEEKGK